MTRRALGPVLVVSLVALGLAPLACSSGSGGLPSIVTNPAVGDGAIFIPLPFDAATTSDAAVTPEGGSGDAAGDAPSDECNNGKVDPNETDIDCGGPKCRKCPTAKKCQGDSDCVDGFCHPPTKLCKVPTCIDEFKNGDETDADCGGTTCKQCAVGRRCKVDLDCKSTACNTVDSACACPARMVTVSKAAGTAYCIDETEVTNGDYDKFIRANVPAASASSYPTAAAFMTCAGSNPTFVPTGDWPPPQPLSDASSYGRPVRYVDWCDAIAYCKWAGKELCGSTDGGVVAPAAANDASKDAWFNACSAQGANDYPYGNSFDGAKCYTNQAAMGAGQVAEYQDTGAYSSIPIDPVRPKLRSCQGGVVGLFHMSGNVAEWENSCDTAATPPTCRVRGGSFRSTLSSQVACNADDLAASAPPTTKADNIGIRCCLF